ncbi:hypothetical protein HPT25_23160 [Bacillus sp. BRMEA1]|uniref:hypothetical protein n=1 Tax=Neobacillus endophyticus TaxID=2738405 RepID=UPI0015651DF9|nr:hypothetical protein [Neobacillus endophyticus]NRD80234.1 hypothetical protein [Neobacillus endophyticus]
MKKPIQVQIMKPRITKMYLGSWGSSFLHNANPWVAAWWSAALPGFGHMKMGLFLKGAMFLTGEIILNFLAKINLALYYTLNFQWEKAQSVINYEFAFLYAGIWIFSIWDSYRLAVEINKISWLESKQKVRHFEHDSLIAQDLNFLEKRNPWVGLFWSCIFTGFGHIYVHKILLGFILIGWMYAITFNAHFPLLVIYTFTGQFDKIHSILNYSWLPFIPSIYFFGIYDAYSSVIYNNHLFKEEQAYYFKENYGKNKLTII